MSDARKYGLIMFILGCGVTFFLSALATNNGYLLAVGAFDAVLLMVVGFCIFD